MGYWGTEDDGRKVWRDVPWDDPGTGPVVTYHDQGREDPGRPAEAQQQQAPAPPQQAQAPAAGGGGGAKVDYHVRAPRPGETSGAYIAEMTAANVDPTTAWQVFGGARPSNVVVYENNGGVSTPQKTVPVQQRADAPTSTNQTSGGGGGGNSGGGGGAAVSQATASAAQTPDWAQEVLRQLAESERLRVEEEKRRWELQHALARNADERAAAGLHIQEADQKLRELSFKETQRQFDASLYTNLAQSLLGTAVTLGNRPQDWVQYQQFTRGGQSLMEQLYGNQPIPEVGLPNGQTGTLDDLLAALGLGGGGASPTPWAPMNAAAPAGQAVGPSDGKLVPWQIDPARYDAIGPIGQGLTRGLAMAQGWDADDFERQLNATRPQGSAARSTRTTYADPTAVF